MLQQCKSEIFFSILLCMSLGACRVSQKTDGEALVGELLIDGESDSGDDSKSVPVSLWSPAQRQSSASYYFLAGEMMTLRGEAARALPVFEAAYGMDPNPFIASRMISAKAVAGNRAEAEADAHKMVLLYPKDARLRFLYGEMLMGNKRWSDAAEQFQRSIEIDPDNETTYLMLSAAFHAEKHFDKAIAAANRLIKRMPGSVLGWSALARLYIGSSKKKEALAPALRAYELKSAEPENALILAIAYELNNRSKDAMSLYEQLYRLNPTNDELTTRMVEIYQQLGNLEDALQLLEDTERASKEKKPGIRMQRAIILWELKRNQEAADILTNLVKEFPDSDRLTYMSAIGQEKLGRAESALEIYVTIPKASPFKPGGEFRRALILKDLKRLPEAEEVTSALLENQEPTAEVYILAASIYSDGEKFAKAIETLVNGNLVYPDNHRLLFLKGVYEERDGRIRDCMATMRQVIKLDSQNSSAYNFLGYMYAERGENLEEAEKLVKRALELKPDDGFYLDSLGWIQFQSGRFDEALVTLEKAAKIVPDEGVIWEHLADVLEKKGRNDEAVKAFDKALATKLEPRDQKRIIGKAEALRKKIGMAQK